MSLIVSLPQALRQNVPAKLAELVFTKLGEIFGVLLRILFIELAVHRLLNNRHEYACNEC